MNKVHTPSIWIPVVIALIIGTFFVGILVSVIKSDDKKNSFIEACKTMGGVPLVGTYNTRVCLKSEVLK